MVFSCKSMYVCSFLLVKIAGMGNKRPHTLEQPQLLSTLTTPSACTYLSGDDVERCKSASAAERRATAATSCEACELDLSTTDQV